MKQVGNTVADLLHKEICKAQEFCGEEGYEISPMQKKEIADDLATALLTTDGMERPQDGLHSKLYRLRRRQTGLTEIVAAALCTNAHPLVRIRNFHDEELATAYTGQDFSNLPNIIYPFPPRL